MKLKAECDDISLPEAAKVYAMNPRLLWGGMKSYLPLGEQRYLGTGGTSSAVYSHSVWFRHLFLVAHHLGQRSFKPETVVEVGPGDSIGMGLAALLSVADTYIGLDAVAHASIEVNLRILDQLLEILEKKADLQGDDTFPRVYPRLSTYAFPKHLVSDAELTARLRPERVSELRNALHSMTKRDNPRIRYQAPWNVDSVAPNSVDYIFSQSVLDELDHEPQRDDLTRSLVGMASWLKPGGVMSHQIELSCPGGSPWNHHWAYGRRTWAIIRGRRPYYRNRVPLSRYIQLFDQVGCPVIAMDRVVNAGLARHDAAQQFRHLPDEDFNTSSVFVVAVKRA